MTIGTTIEANWNKFTGEIKQLYGKLTDQELEYGAKGEWDKLKGAFKEGYSDSEDAQNDFNARVDAYRAQNERDDSVLPNQMQTEGTWDTVVGKLKQMYGKLTDQEWKYGSEGKWDELKGSFKKSYGDSQEAMDDFDNQTARFRNQQNDGSCGTSCGCTDNRDAA